MSNNNNIILPLSTLIQDLLSGEHYRKISRTTAETILHSTGNKHSCFIQRPGDTSISDEPLQSYVLWDLAAWRSSVERTKQSRIRAQYEREQRFIFEANVKRVRRAIMNFSALDEASAHVLARIMIETKDKNRLGMLGIKKLYDNIRELP